MLENLQHKWTSVLSEKIVSHISGSRRKDFFKSQATRSCRFIIYVHDWKMTKASRTWVGLFGFYRLTWIGVASVNHSEDNVCCWFAGEWGGEWGKQVGSMNEESQVRGCYNITFYLHQPGNSVGSPLRWTPAATANKQPASAGTLGEKGRCRPSAQVLTL